MFHLFIRAVLHCQTLFNLISISVILFSINFTRFSKDSRRFSKALNCSGKSLILSDWLIMILFYYPIIFDLL